MGIFVAVAALDHDSGRLPFTPSLACTKLMNSTQPLSPKDLCDTDVMFGVQAHDRRALEKLYLTYYGPLARFLSRIVAQTGTVEEIINDTFITIWMRAKEFRGESRVAAWIVGIVYRTALQSTGRHRVRGPLSFAEISRRRDSDFTSENPFIDRLERRLNRLPLEERVTVALAYQMGFSIDEIAEITQVAPATVKVRMFQARLGIHPVA
jgi:RNA polymerase sigma-70 factor, ECF subfamily